MTHDLRQYYLDQRLKVVLGHVRRADSCRVVPAVKLRNLGGNVFIEELKTNERGNK